MREYIAPCNTERNIMGHYGWWMIMITRCPSIAIDNPACMQQLCCSTSMHKVGANVGGGGLRPLSVYCDDS